MTKCEELSRRIDSALNKKNGDALESLSREMCDFVSDQRLLPESCFEYILALLADERYLSLVGAWHLLTVFDLHWRFLTDQQRTDLLAALENAYEQFEDWMGCFLTTEILGKRFFDSRALSILVKLRQKCVKPAARSLLPHGFEHLARVSDPLVAGQAKAELQGMLQDTSEEVRNEARESLLRLQSPTST